ncbi:invasion associated locus B family protein [Bradyrhizobium sp. 1]|uniref:invasion associated locus B family protein n=1 Tax=Bradyrhizobium sp. 1 TaxID=241591 RepID=UPI001FF95407|nr:invasion associated locus B family protein [Bradyrhizobium sp. 1]MCK1394634.1 invasion associated locus B family protein [Bradyrhizobium sp. 1]
MSNMPLRWFGSVALACLVATPVIAEEAGTPALTFSPWTKHCLGDTCFIGKDGRRNVIGPDNLSNINCGSVVSALLVERSVDDKKALRVMLPPSVSRGSGVRIIIDQGQPIERPYMHCLASGCTAEYLAGPELVDQLKRGQSLFVGAIDKTDSPVALTIPLADFANAYDGPSHEPKVYEKVYHSKEECWRIRSARNVPKRTARPGARRDSCPCRSLALTSA